MFFSPGTGWMSTFTVVRVANCTWPRLWNVTVFCSPGLIRSIVFVWTIGDGVCWIVSVTLTCTSCESPVSSIVTAKPRSVVAVTVFSVGSRAPGCPGSAFVEISAVPCRPPRRAAGRRRALEPLEDRLPEARARVVGVGDEARVGHGDAGDPLPAQLLDRRILEQVVPDDVAGDEPLGLPGEEERVAGHVLRRARRPA